jgi:hypothetical protein
MRRLRKTGAVDQDGTVITIPRLPSVTDANKPPGWNRWSPAEKVEHLLGMSLDRMAEILGWPADGLYPYRLAAHLQAARVISVIAAKAGCGRPNTRRPSVFGKRWSGHRRFVREAGPAAEAGSKNWGPSRKLRPVSEATAAVPTHFGGALTAPQQSHL